MGDLAVLSFSIYKKKFCNFWQRSYSNPGRRIQSLTLYWLRHEPVLEIIAFVVCNIFHAQRAAVSAPPIPPPISHFIKLIYRNNGAIWRPFLKAVKAFKRSTWSHKNQINVRNSCIQLLLYFSCQKSISIYEIMKLAFFQGQNGLLVAYFFTRFTREKNGKSTFRVKISKELLF